MNNEKAIKILNEKIMDNKGHAYKVDKDYFTDKRKEQENEAFQIAIDALKNQGTNGEQQLLDAGFERDKLQLIDNAITFSRYAGNPYPNSDLEAFDSLRFWNNGREWVVLMTGHHHAYTVDVINAIALLLQELNEKERTE